MDQPEQIRSYQRIFAPDHRIYHVEGRQIPIPGGIPITALAYFAGVLLTVLVLQAGSVFLALLLAAIAALYGLYVGNAASAGVAGVATFLLVPIAGQLLGVLDWPLRYLILPAAVATLATQVAPDGRKPHRFALSWVAFLLRPRRRSLGRAIPLEGCARARYDAELWVAPDEGGEDLRRARVHGPALVRFRDELAVRQRRRGRLVTARQLPAGQQPRRREVAVDSVELDADQVLEVRT